MKAWINKDSFNKDSINKVWLSKTLLTRRLIVPVMAVALAVSFTAYEFIKPAYARGPVASPTATPLDDNSVAALLALDQAMETLAARVTPAVVNVAVTSH